jgi:hypothetical protein
VSVTLDQGEPTRTVVARTDAKDGALRGQPGTRESIPRPSPARANDDSPCRCAARSTSQSPSLAPRQRETESRRTLKGMLGG